MTAAELCKDVDAAIIRDPVVQLAFTAAHARGRALAGLTIIIARNKRIADELEADRGRVEEDRGDAHDLRDVLRGALRAARRQRAAPLDRPDRDPGRCRMTRLELEMLATILGRIFARRFVGPAANADVPISQGSHV